jgi:Tetrahydrodipicolinate N-succinyltransferase N-terminal
VKELEQEITRLFRDPPQEGYSREDFRIFEEFKDALNRGEVRAAARRNATWTVNLWVKQGILLGFKMVLIGGNCGVYEGTIIREGAVLGAGTILTGGTPVYDLVRKTLYRRQDDRPLEVPAQAVVVPGTRAVSDGWGKEQQLSIYTPIIVKYRDSKTESRIQLEDLLR